MEFDGTVRLTEVRVGESQTAEVTCLEPSVTKPSSCGDSYFQPSNSLCRGQAKTQTMGASIRIPGAETCRGQVLDRLRDGPCLAGLHVVPLAIEEAERVPHLLTTFQIEIVGLIKDFEIVLGVEAVGRLSFLRRQQPPREAPGEIMEPVAADAVLPVEEAVGHQLAQRFVGRICCQLPSRRGGGGVESAGEDGQEAPEPLEVLRKEAVAQVQGGIDAGQSLAAFGELLRIGGGGEV
jgi:hypothetical protein